MSAFYEGVAEIFEVEASQVDSTFDLAAHNWDSLAIVTMIALVDECENLMLEGADLAKCETLGDIEALIAKARNGG